MRGKDEILEWLYGLSVHGIKLGLTNITELLHRLGDPQDSFRKIHVAGTDGKGSTSSMIASILMRSGVKVGLYTSPHIIEFNERISVSGRNIPDDDMIRLAEMLEPIVEDMRKSDMQCTFFEVTTAMAFQYFKESGVEYAVVEVGMGGRFDATNVIVPDVSIITIISMEHTFYLGDTLTKIAGEKAGIIKPGVPVVTVNTGEALRVIEERASETGSQVIRADAPASVSAGQDSVRFSYKGKDYEVGIPGEFQAMNATMAIEAVSHLPQSERFIGHIEEGLKAVRWPCRMQRLEGLPIILDVTHTKVGSEALANDISRIYGKVTTVFGALSDKDIGGILENLSRISERMIITVPISERSADIGVIERAAREHMEDVTVVPSIFDALDMGMKMKGDGYLLVTGSFIMAEDALKWLRRTSAGY